LLLIRLAILDIYSLSLHDALPILSNPSVASTPTKKRGDVMKIAITGGTGFVGGHLAATMAAEGHELVLLSRRADTARATRTFPRSEEHTSELQVTSGSRMPSSA